MHPKLDEPHYVENSFFKIISPVWVGRFLSKIEYLQLRTSRHEY